MIITNIVIAAVVAGIMMGLATEIGYRIGLIQANLLKVDGEFAVKLLKLKQNTGLVYFAGAVVHLATSASFGAVLYFIAKIFEVDASSIIIIAAYVFALWLSMLFLALPVAGHGILGKRLGGSVWLEQLFLHIIFALGLWSMLNIF
ncbi:MAG: hypothetical protein KKC46_00440 [Proteobacteria bacterium]|nr:hypothetical protein [Pseudomonadota bacterium]